MCLIWHQRNQRGMRVWTAAEGVFTALHHTEQTYTALVQQQHPQLLPAVQYNNVQVVKPAPQALLVVPSLEQCMAVEVANDFSGEKVAGQKQLGKTRCSSVSISSDSGFACLFKVRPAPGGRPAPSPAEHSRPAESASTWLLGMPPSQFKMQRGSMSPERLSYAMHSLSVLCSQPGRRQHR